MPRTKAYLPMKKRKDSERSNERRLLKLAKMFICDKPANCYCDCDSGVCPCGLCLQIRDKFEHLLEEFEEDLGDAI